MKIYNQTQVKIMKKIIKLNNKTINAYDRSVNEHLKLMSRLLDENKRIINALEDYEMENGGGDAAAQWKFEKEIQENI